jgi:heme A synthase
MTTVHNRLAVALIALSVVGLAWTLVGWRRPVVHPGLRAYAVLVLAATVLQGVLGIALAVAGHRPASGLHFFYGPATLLAAAWAAASRADQRSSRMALAVGMSAMFLLGIRAVGTGA